jgi:hypothetical protein
VTTSCGLIIIIVCALLLLLNAVVWGLYLHRSRQRASLAGEVEQLDAVVGKLKLAIEHLDAVVKRR